tara:strand:- start:1661 stop:3814 length:2154 start_codon:yes stop_codon:yes gene_type:complete
MIKPYTIYVGLQQVVDGKNYAVGKIVYIYNKDDTIASLYTDDQATPLPQDGINNITNSRGAFAFYIDNGEYYTLIDGYRQDFSVEGETLAEEYIVQSDDISGNSISLPKSATNVRVVRDGREVPGIYYSLSVDGLTVNLTFTPQATEKYSVWIGNSEQVIIPDTPVDQLPITTHTAFSTQNIINLDNVKVGDTIFTRSYFSPGSLSDADNFGLGGAIYSVEAAGTPIVTNRDFSTKDGFTAVLRNEYRKFPECYGVEYGPTADGTFRTRNRDRMQSCWDDNNFVFVGGRVETFGSLQPHRGLTVEGAESINSEIYNLHPTQATIDDLNTNIGDNLQGFNLYRMQIESELSNAIDITPFQCEFISNRFSAKRGKCLNIRNVAYQSENKYKNNIFRGYEWAVYAPGRDNPPVAGQYDFVDQWFEDNTYDSLNGENVPDLNNDPYTVVTQGGIFAPIASSTVIRGEHFYKRHNGPMITIGGLNIVVVECTFEKNNNSQLYLESGNPESFSIANNKFWFGDGTENMPDGNPIAAITIDWPPYSPARASFTGNIFEGGKNSYPVFRVERGGAVPAETSNWVVEFKSDNKLNANLGAANSYVMGYTVDGIGGQNWMKFITSDHAEFRKLSTTVGESITADTAYSEFVQLDTGQATDSKALPNSTNVFRWNKGIMYTNASSGVTTTLSPGGSTTIVGDPVVPPGKKVLITEHPDRGNQFLILPR